MNQSQVALGRSRAYDLFGQLFRRGLTADLLPSVMAIEALASTIPTPFDSDESAAAHQRLFGFNVFPHESVFLDPSAILGGPIAEAISHFYAQVDFQHDDDAGPDHMGHELALLAHLCATEAGAWQEGSTSQALQARRLQRSFLDEHLLCWLPALCQAIGQQGQSFFTDLADLALALVLDHRADLGGDPQGAELSFALPPAPNVLASDRTGLKEIAAYLLTPAYSGFYLSRDDIARLGRQHRLPRGFGQRQQMMTNLLRSAAQYDSLPQLLADLQNLIGLWTAAYQRLQESSAWHAGRVAGPWLDRLAFTSALVRQLQSASLLPAEDEDGP